MSQASKVVYFSFDIEANGRSPALHSMLSIGIVAYDETGKELTSFQRNIEPIEGHIEEKRCMDAFWANQPEAWKFVNTNKIKPITMIKELEEWLQQFQGQKWKWIAKPASYDWQWLKYYHERFKTSTLDIGFKCVCLSSMLDVYCKLFSIRDKDEFEKKLAGDLPYTHNPEDDARFQGRVYFNLLKFGSCL
jgi:hypothetical protein